MVLFSLVMKITAFLLLCLATFHLSAQQSNLKSMLQNSQEQWLVNHFFENAPEEEVFLECPPELLQEIPGQSAVDEALHPYRFDQRTEAACINLYFDDDCAGIYSIRLLSDLYFPLFERHLAANNLDEDYKFLPIALSGLYSGYDDGSNRAGLWAIDYPRARMMGLRVDQMVDERKSPSHATEAAVKLLKEYTARYPDDPLRVMVAMLRGVPFADQFTPGEGDEDLRMRLTLLHVTIRLFKHTDAHHHLMTWLNLLNSFDAIPVREDLSYKALEDKMSLHPALLRGLNPAFHGNELPGGYRDVPFLLPKDQIDTYLSQQDSLYCYKPEEEALKAYREQQEKREPSGDAIYYTIRSGDVLGVIAERFGVRTSDLRAWNNLRGDRIYAGQELVIYGAKGPAQKRRDDAAAQSSESRPTPRETVAPKGAFETYIVQEGESLWLIARKFPGVSADNIMEWNGIGTDIRPGQQLKIYKE
jgi:membrane-bound lytic murein transglycosylase D